MKQSLSVLAIAALALAGCVSAQANTSRVAGTADIAHYAVGNTTNSIDEVHEALKHDDLRAEVHENLSVLLTKSEDFGTSFEFERDLIVCEQIHPIPADHEADHPESRPLANCVLRTFETHQVGQS